MNYNNIKCGRAFVVNNALVYCSCPVVLPPVADIAHYQYTFSCIPPDQMALIYIHATQSSLYMAPSSGPDTLEPITILLDSSSTLQGAYLEAFIERRG
jgi:hypothetical protein